MKLGRGWAPEKLPDENEVFAIRELRTLIHKIFESRKLNNGCKGSKFQGISTKHRWL